MKIFTALGDDAVGKVTNHPSDRQHRGILDRFACTTAVVGKLEKKYLS